jgi:hypothetical protein
MKARIIKHSVTILFFVLLLLAPSKFVSAGFGISPPYLKNQQLTPGSKYEQTIVLLRSSSDGDLKATVKIKADRIASWITIDKGTEFILPKGEVQVPMLVTVNVPKDAELGNYTGSINVKVSAADSQGPGVAIALGARVDIDLTLTNVSYADFIVRVASIPDFEMLKWPWDLAIFSHFLHRISVVLNIENRGNVETAPSKVTLDVFDMTRNNTLETLTDKSLDKIPAFSTKEVVARFPTKLGLGQYWGRVKVYKGSTIVNSYEIAFTIAKPGELPGGGPGLGYYPYLLAGAYLLGLLVLLFLFFRFRVYKAIFLVMLAAVTRPLRPVYKFLAGIAGAIKIKFWKWMGSKASKYNRDKD